MADEDITLDGKPLQSLRVADLKAALEQRNLPKSGQKNTLVKRLKGALMLENLQKTSSSHMHSGLQPNSQIGEEMCQNSFIKQYLAKQQELLRQRLEREATQNDEADESPSVPEEDEEHSEDNDSPSCVTEKNCPIPSHSTLSRPGRAVSAAVVGHGFMSIQSQESPEALQTRVQRAVGHQEPVPSPPRAVASLSVRILGEADRQGLPPAVPRVYEKEGTAPSQPGSAQSVLHLSRSAGVTAGSVVLKDSSDDDDDDDDGDDECEDDEDWGSQPGKGKTVPPKPQQMPSTMLSSGGRSKRKLQVPQHIPPPQAQHSPMQLRHPTPPPSPPSNLFPLPDTPKQSPPEPDDQDRDVAEPALDRRAASFLPPSVQMQDSDSSSGSSSPDPPAKSKPGPLSLLVHKMESEGAFQASMEMSEDTSHSTAGSSSESPLQKLKKKRQEENIETEIETQLKKVKERGGQQVREREEHYSEEKKKDREKEQHQYKENMETKLNTAENEGRGKKTQDEVEIKEESGLKEEKDMRQKTANRDRKVMTKQRESDSSDSDSKSDSASQSSSSSSDKTLSARQNKLLGQTHKQKVEEEHKTTLTEEVKKRHLSTRRSVWTDPQLLEVSEPSAAAVTEVEPDSESSMADQPASGAEPENSENRLEESTTTKAFAARKISLTNPKTSPATTDGGGAGEGEAGVAAGRKRRWGSSTAVTAKKPSISITTESLKSLIPDIKLEAVVDLHPEELQLSGDEGKQENNHSDEDKGLKIRRTVTQVVQGDTQENGQEEDDEEEEVQEQVEKMEKTEKEKHSSRDRRKSSVSEETSESQTFANMDGDVKKVTPRDSLVRRSISQQKSGVSVTIDDPVCAVKQPSPPRGQISKIIHVTNLVRPFTLGQLKELLNRTGSVLEDGFWIDKIKSHCYVTYATTEEAVSTRNAIHGVKWPSSNPKVLSVDFCGQDELDFHRGILKPEKEVEHIQVQAPGAPHNRLPPLMPERDRDRERERDRDRDREEKDREHERDRERGAAGVRDIWAEREREMERRERARGEREWDRDKIREYAGPGEDERRSRSRERERRRRERARSKERKTDKKEKGDEPPAKLLDDLFLKTKAPPCIYWLPLTEEQAAQRLLDRTERQKERERRRKEQQEEEDKKREEEKKERLKIREKDGGGGGGSAGGGGSGGGGGGGGSGGSAAGSAAINRGADRRGTNGDREREKERERGRDKEGDTRRDSGGHRPQRLSGGPGSGRRSRSRSNPRDRRR